MFRNETRHSQFGVRVIDRIDPATDPFQQEPRPDPALVQQLNRRWAVLSDGEVVFASKLPNQSFADARRRNQELATDAYSVSIINIDDLDVAGNHVWSAIRGWLSANADDLAAPPLAPPKPENSPEAKAALATTRVLSTDGMWELASDVWFFAERVASKTSKSTTTHTTEIAGASRTKLEAVLLAHRLNQSANGRPFHVRAVNVAADAMRDSRDVVEHGPYRQYVRAMRTDAIAAGRV